MKRHSMIIGLLLSGVFLYLAFRKTDFGELWTHLSTARYWLLAPASLITILSLYVRALRWGLLLAPLERVGPNTLFSATSIGFMSNNLLPMRLGEVIRAYVLSRSTGLRGSAAFATIIIERLFDLFCMIGIFGILLVFAPFYHRSFKFGVLFAFVAGFIALAGLVFFYLKPEPITRLVGWCLPARIRDRLIGMLQSFGEGLGILRDFRRLVGIGVLTLVMWGLITVVIELCFASARLESGGTELPATASLMVLVVMAIGVMVPSGPGFVGTLQAAAVLGLAIIGYRDTDRALSFSILYHATQWFPVVFVGLIYLIRENLSLAQVQRISRQEDLEPPAQG